MARTGATLSPRVHFLCLSTHGSHRQRAIRWGRGSVLLALTMLLMFTQIGDLRANEAGKARWNRGTIIVYDYTSSKLDGYVAQIVKQWNAVLPATLQLSYQRAEMRENCEGVPDKVNGAMVVCNQVSFPQYPAGVTDVLFKQGKNGAAQITSTRTILVAETYGTRDPESGPWGFPLGCHELGHALGLNHPGDWNEDTCMSAFRDTPSASDAAALQSLYKEKGKGVSAAKAKNKKRNKR